MGAAISYIADTGNDRIVQFDPSDNFVRAITVTAHGLSFSEPCGVSIDDENKLIVTDRSQNMVFRVEADGTLLAFWDMQGLLHAGCGWRTRQYYPELAGLLKFASPTRAVVNPRGLLAVADTGHDRVRLVSIHTTLQGQSVRTGRRACPIFRSASSPKPTGAANWVCS